LSLAFFLGEIFAGEGDAGAELFSTSSIARKSEFRECFFLDDEFFGRGTLSNRRGKTS